MNNEEKTISDVEKLTYEVIAEDNLSNWAEMSPREIASMMKDLVDIIEDKNKKIDQLEKQQKEIEDFETIYQGGVSDEKKILRDRMMKIIELLLD